MFVTFLTPFVYLSLNMFNILLINCSVTSSLAHVKVREVNICPLRDDDEMDLTWKLTVNYPAVKVGNFDHYMFL